MKLLISQGTEVWEISYIFHNLVNINKVTPMVNKIRIMHNYYANIKQNMKQQTKQITQDNTEM